jgi:hypothetical protein
MQCQLKKEPDMDDYEGFDEYGMYENDLQTYSDNEAWEDAMADAANEFEYDEYGEDLG